MNQREMPFLGAVRDLRDAPSELVNVCQNEHQAVLLCITLSGFTDEFISEKLGIDKGHMSRIRSGAAQWPTRKRLSLMRLCGNRAPVQYEAAQVGCNLVERSKDQRIRELEETLAQLKQERAA